MKYRFNIEDQYFGNVLTLLFYSLYFYHDLIDSFDLSSSALLHLISDGNGRYVFYAVSHTHLGWVNLLVIGE